MYLFITSSDILMTIFLLIQHILLELFYFKSAPAEAASVLIILSTAIMGACYRCSVFANILLAVARTIQIRNPFYLIHKSHVHLAFAIYLGCWLTLATYDVVYMVAIDYYGWGVVTWADAYSTHPTTGYGVADTLLHWRGSVLLDLFLSVVLLFLPFMPPAIIALVCMIIQIHVLNKPPPPGVPDRVEEQRHMTVTILLLTTVFCICNSCFSMWWLLYYIGEFNESYSFDDLIGDTTFRIINCATVTTLPLLNAVCSPIILITRSTALKAAMGGSIRRVLGLQNAVNPPPPEEYRQQNRK